MVMHLKEVHMLENVNYREEFITDLQEGDLLNTMNQLMVAVRFALNNLVRSAVQQAADVYRNDCKVVQSEIKGMALTGKLVMCSPFTESIVEDKRCNFIISDNEQMDNRMVVLTKTNPLSIGEYSLTVIEPAPGKIGVELAVKFDFSDVQGGVTYTINEGY